MDYIKEIRKSIGHTLLQMPSVTIINFNKEGKILLLHHRDTNAWVAPGGSIEPGETPANAAVREMYEETGLFVDLVEIIGVYGGPEFVVNYSNGDKTSYVMTVFKSRKISGNLEAIDNEAKELAYFTLKDAMSLNIPDWVKKLLPKWFERDSKADFDKPNWKPE